MHHLILFIVCILFVEVFKNFEFFRHLREILSISSKALNIIRSRKISDHWKEVILPVYSFQLMKSSFVLFLMFGFLIFLIFVGGLIDPFFFKFILGFVGIIESIFFCYVYSRVRRYFKNE